MIIDGATVASGSTIEADLCLIGAGPAAQTIIRGLSGIGVRIVSLDAGPASGAAPGGAARAPRALRRILLTRREGIGGTADVWGGRIEGLDGQYARLAPPSALDFAPRPSVGLPGWPLDLAALRPFYERAHQLYRLPPFNPPPQDHTADDVPRLPADLWMTFSGYVNRDEFIASGRELYGATDHDVYVNAAALAVDSSATGATVQVATSPTTTFAVRARYVVLAGGGLENARLIVSSAERPDSGFAGVGDQAGRHFMEHPLIWSGVLRLSDEGWLDRTDLFDIREVEGDRQMANLSLADDVREREDLLGFGAFLAPRTDAYATPAARSLFMMRHALHTGTPLRAPGRHMLAITRAPRDLLRSLDDYRTGRLRFREWYGGWSRLPEFARPATFQVVALTEQAPHAENRLVFDGEADDYGRRLPRLEWTWHAPELRSIKRSYELLAELMADNHIGTLAPYELYPGRNPAWVPGHHHLGTTRMSQDPSEGVVDTDCRVHGTQNVYVAGSSVFPSGAGWANPTLTLLALAVRLGDHLRTLFQPDAAPAAANET